MKKQRLMNARYCWTALLMLASSLFAQATWQAYDENPNDPAYRGITFFKNRFIAVGDQGLITALPVEESGPKFSGVKAPLFSIAHGDSLIVATSPTGAILFSTDGDHWTKSEASANQMPIVAVTCGNNQFVAVGRYGMVRTSSDAHVWAPHESGISRILHSVAYGNKKFIAVGDSAVILTSPDGAKWTKRNPGSEGSGINCIGYGNGHYVALGYNALLTSSDGKTWTGTDAGKVNSINAVAFGNGQFIAVGFKGLIATSQQ